MLLLSTLAALAVTAPPRSEAGSALVDVRCAVLSMTAGFEASQDALKQVALDRAHALIARAQAREPEIDMVDWFEAEAAEIELMSPEDVAVLRQACARLASP